MQAQDICTLARQVAKCPGFTTQSGQLLNYILQDLNQTYDFDVVRKTSNFTFDTSASGNGYAIGSGPNVMPDNFLRARRNGAFYLISGVPYPLIGVDQERFDMLVQQAGLNSYPQQFYVDVSTAPAGLYVWPPASGAFAATVRYSPQMTDITTPESSTTVPWFPNTNYLLTRLAGELMKITDDERWTAYLGEGAQGAQGILEKYLTMKDDPETTAKRVTLDRSRFGVGTDRLRNTKSIGWVVALGLYTPLLYSYFGG